MNRLLVTLWLPLAMPAAVKVGAFAAEVRTFYSTADGLPSGDVRDIVLRDGKVCARTASGSACLAGGKWTAAVLASPASPDLSGFPRPAAVRGSAAHAGRTAVAATDGLYLREGGTWRALYPSNGRRSWAPVDVRAVTFDQDGRLWFACPQGVGRFDGSWKLYTG